MNPYLEPFTMPDGTTRRAIVERVPECRPRRANVLGRVDLGTSAELVVMWTGDRCGWLTPGNRTDAAVSVDDTSALALCRVACEDWLMKCGHVISLAAEGGGYRNVNVPGILDVSCGSMEGIHAALVHAAHAVADAKGIPH